MTTIHYLEQRSADALRATADAGELDVREARIKQYQLNRFLYRFVGAPWNWTDRLVWTDAQWKAYAENDKLRTWVASVDGSPAGYYELQQQDGGDVEIVLFGLAQKFIGRKLGGAFLSHALRSAWTWEGTQRVWLHTCTHDHPHALKNYLARGMELYHSETRDG